MSWCVWLRECVPKQLEYEKAKIGNLSFIDNWHLELVGELRDMKPKTNFIKSAGLSNKFQIFSVVWPDQSFVVM